MMMLPQWYHRVPITDDKLEKLFAVLTDGLWRAANRRVSTGANSTVKRITNATIANYNDCTIVPITEWCASSIPWLSFVFLLSVVCTLLWRNLIVVSTSAIMNKRWCFCFFAIRWVGNVLTYVRDGII